MSNLEGILGSAARLIFQLSKIQMFLAHQRTQKSIEKSFCHFKKVLIQKSNLIDIKQIIYQKQIYTNKKYKIRHFCCTQHMFENSSTALRFDNNLLSCSYTQSYRTVVPTAGVGPGRPKWPI